MMNWVERLNHALAYIDGNLCGEIDFNEIARITLCPMETVQRFFVLNTGITLKEYIRRRKLYEAFNELRTTDIKIADLSVKYGYDSPDAFSVAFKRIYGAAPAIAKNDKNITVKPFLRMTFFLSVSYIQGGEIMELMNSENIIELLANSHTAAQNDEMIEKLILNGEEYIALEKIIEGTLDKKFIKIMLPIKEKSPDWENFYTCLEIGVMDGALELSDIKSCS